MLNYQRVIISETLGVYSVVSRVPSGEYYFTEAQMRSYVSQNFLGEINVGGWVRPYVSWVSL